MSEKDKPDDWDNGGGPAFPTEDAEFFWSGMELRDYFAAQAMRAIVETDGYEIAEGRRLLAANCYLIADAMIAERSKP